MDMQSKLSAPFEPSKVHWRVGSTNRKKFDDGNAKNGRSGMPLAYIDARDVMNRLDEVCGIGGWSDKYEDFKGRLICVLSIKIDGEWVSKSDGADDTDVEGAKGGISDAFKRAAVKWGIGRYLYDVASFWVELDEWWQITESSNERLAKALIAASNNQPRAKIQLSTDQLDELKTMLNAANITESTYCAGKKIASLDDVTVDMFEDSKVKLLKIISTLGKPSCAA